MKTIKRAVSHAVQLLPPLYRQINRTRRFRLHEPQLKLPCTVLGTSYGGWGIPAKALNEDSIVYSVGVGEDVSFDLELIRCCKCHVFAFDPTPIAIQFIQKSVLPSELKFVPIGIGSSDGPMKFFSPQTSGFHSFCKTIDPTEGESAEVECEVLTLKSIMAKLGHDRIDLLKLDIEGFEYEVIAEMIRSGTLPKLLLVEFHHLTYGIEVSETNQTVEALKKCGYRIFWVSDLGKEYGFQLQ